MTKVIIIVGLPGSGKTSYIKNNLSLGENPLICDDYHESSSSFERSKYYPELCRSLKENRVVIISDIVYCEKEKLDWIINNLKMLGKKLNVKIDLEILYFENNPEMCKKNILDRERKERVDKELLFVEKFSPKYKIPKRAKIIPVFDTRK